MNILGIGPLELLVIIVLLLLVMGPNDLVKAARKGGEFIRKAQQSDVWQAVRGSRKAISKFSDELISGAELDEVKIELAELNAMRDRNKRSIEDSLKSLQEESFQIEAPQPSDKAAEG